MLTQTWIMGWRMALMACILQVWLAIPVSVSGQCFDDSNTPCGTTDGSGANATARGSIDFAISLFKSVAKPPSLPESGNCHISPASVRFALIIVYVGTRNSTKTQMQTALWLGNDNQRQVLQTYRKYKKAIAHNATETAKYTLNIGDRIYFEKSFKLRACMRAYLRSELQQADFRLAPEASRQLMNQWVENQTANKIVNLFPEGSITSDTRMVIVNAVYMKAAWIRPFEPSGTREGDFFVNPNMSKKVSMMHQTSEMPYGISSQLGCKAVEMPYSGYEISMVLLLPDTNVHDMIDRLNAKDLRDLLSKLNDKTVELTMPKFNLTQSFKLNENLKSLGIKDLFERGKADLSGFTDEDVYVTDVYQKTFIDVNEHGTEAAAATGAVVGPTFIVIPQVSFTVNCPFLFIIRNVKYNSVLFMGLINDPTITS